MIELGVAFAAFLAVLGALSRMRTRPSLCPACYQPTLQPDKRGVVWRCMPCNRRWVRIGADFIEHAPRLLGEESIPVAKIRLPDD